MKTLLALLLVMCALLTGCAFDPPYEVMPVDAGVSVEATVTLEALPATRTATVEPTVTIAATAVPAPMRASVEESIPPAPLPEKLDGKRSENGTLLMGEDWWEYWLNLSETATPTVEPTP